MKAKKETEATHLPVNYSIPLLEFMRGSSKEEGVILQVGRLDKKFINHDEEFIQKIPDLGDGLVTRQVEEYWPAKHGDKNLFSALKSLAARESDPKYGSAFQLADFRTAVEYIRKHGGPVYSNPYPQFKTYFQVGDKVYDMNYGMWPDYMNMRHNGPGIGFGRSNVLVSEELDQDDVLLVVPKQEGSQIILPEDPKEEVLPDGEVILRSEITTYYGGDNLRIVRDFCDAHRLMFRAGISGPSSPHEIFRTEKQKGDVRNNVVEFWFPGERDKIDFLDVNVVVYSILPHLTGTTWELAIPHDVISYLEAHSEKIGAHNFCTRYKGRREGEALMIVGRWEKGQENIGLALVEIEPDTLDNEILLPPGFHFLAVESKN